MARRPDATMGLADLSDSAPVRVLTPRYFTRADVPWLRALLEERERFVGATRGCWKQRLREGLPMRAPKAKLQTALRVLDRLARDRREHAAAARAIRTRLFREATSEPVRERVWSRTAAALGLSEEAVREGVFADLPDERQLAPLSEPVGPDHLVLCNADVVASLLTRALRVRAYLRGKVRAVVRHAKLVGLLCQVGQSEPNEDLVLDISGPFALFRHTAVYARALASLVPRLACCERFRLEADCVMRGQDVGFARLVIRPGDPLLPGRELEPFDSQLEQRFARAFAKLAPAWDIVREPVAINAGSSLVFPDFELRHRATGVTWLLEIAGYWTAEYVARKLAALREAHIHNLILCLDEARACSAQDLAGIDAKVVRFRRKVDAAAVLAVIEAELQAGR